MGYRLLIVEDDLSFKRILEIRLKSWRPDIVIEHAQNLAKAREILSSSTNNFSLLILDQHLPDGRGAELLNHPALESVAVLAVSSDDKPELPGQAVMAGAQHFLGKRQVSEPLFIPLIEALIERKSFENEALKAKVKDERLRTIKVLLSTLRHEINNPLGAVMGGAYLIGVAGKLTQEQQEGLKLVEQSSDRIKNVIEQLCQAAELEEVNKANEQVFHVPGDKPWGSK